MAKLDEVAFNVLLADGLDVPTAYAASIEDSEPQPATYSNRFSFDLGLVVGLAIYVAYQLT